MTQNTKIPRHLELPELTGRGAHALIWAYHATISVIALGSLNDVRSAAIVYSSVLLFGAIWFALTRDTKKRVDVRVGIFVVATSVLVAMLSSDNALQGGFSQWYVGSGALAMFYLSLRGRHGLAWIGFIAMGIVVLAWGVSTEDRVLESVLLVARQAPFILVGSLFSVGMRSLSRRLEGVQEAETARAAAEAATLARTAERSRRLAALDSAVGAQLQDIADGIELTAIERQELLSAEAQLRDSLRARQLDVPEIVAAVQRARRRQLVVTLLDDRYPQPLPAATLRKIIDAAVKLLDEANDGSVTIRILPAGRPLAATMVSDGHDYVRIEIPAPAATSG